MGNDKRKNRKELFEANKRAQVTPDRLWDRISELLVKARNQNISFMIKEIEQAQSDLKVHWTNRNKVNEISTKIEQLAKQLATFDRSKSKISKNYKNENVR